MRVAPNEDVVEMARALVHRDADAVGLQHSREGLAGELAS